MKVLFISLFLGFNCLSLSAQRNDFYQKGESLISIRNPKLGIQGSRNEWVSIIGSHLDYGYFFKDRWLMGGGVQMFYSRLDGNNNNGYYWGLQLFGRYYFSPLGKKQQFIFFTEPRLEGLRSFSQSIASGGDFVATSDVFKIGAGLSFAWRPRQQLSFDIGVQPQLSWGKAIGAGQGAIYSLGFVPLGIWGINIHL